MGLFDIFRRKSATDGEALRRAFLHQKGRITEGTIIDTEISEAGDEIAYYYYTVSGADYESSEILTDEQKQDPLSYAPGAKVSVRFDPKNHGNSILV
jgi:hypothetical protein